MSSLDRLLYDRKEAARVLSISVRSLDYLVSNLEIRTKRIGRRLLIPQTELLRFIKADHPNTLRTT
ncbi:helix-turn-helix domain-containing protein [Acidipila sp. EB88]|uniref:helix-turn-helix domain-containing protein n=1 Tax=Acidipila sp. EB88 TaxID=2305226 RepID=UPI000F6002DE|nr:DNA-binding protein [Acidipila sp. EB88]